MSTAKFNTWLNPDGTQNYKCRAWVNFNASSGTPSIRSSGNISSITDNGVGDFTLNFTTAMPDANFAVATSGMQANNTNFTSEGGQVMSFNYATGSVRLGCKQDGAGGARDFFWTSAAIFR